MTRPIPVRKAVSTVSLRRPTLASVVVVSVALVAASVLSAVPAAATVSGSSVSSPRVLVAGDSLTSPSGAYTFVVQGDGNAVVYQQGAGPIWWSGTDGHPGSTMALQADGNLVVYGPDHRPLWYDAASDPDAYLVMQDDGNLVEYDPYGALWSSKGGLIGQRNVGGSVLRPGQVLRGGPSLVAGDYTLSEQSDGGLLEYTTTGRTIWTTGPRYGWSWVMQGDGNFVGYNVRNLPVFWTGTNGHPGAWLALQTDGNVVVYSAAGAALWASGVDAHPTTPAPMPTPILGASCRTSGATGVDANGRPLVCAFYVSDAQYHWRPAL